MTTGTDKAGVLVWWFRVWVKLMERVSSTARWSFKNPQSNVFRQLFTSALGSHLKKPASYTMSTSAIRSAMSLRQQLVSKMARSAMPARPAARAFSQSALLASAQGGDKGYDKHRVEVDPKMAGVDSSITFEQPKVSKLRPRSLAFDVEQKD